MQCTRCNKLQQKSKWKPSQWKLWQPETFEFNCCKDCDDSCWICPIPTAALEHELQTMVYFWERDLNLKSEVVKLCQDILISPGTRKGLSHQQAKTDIDPGNYVGYHGARILLGEQLDSMGISNHEYGYDLVEGLLGYANVHGCTAEWVGFLRHFIERWGMYCKQTGNVSLPPAPRRNRWNKIREQDPK